MESRVLGLRVCDLGLWGLGYIIQILHLGFEDWGLGCRVLGFGV